MWDKKYQARRVRDGKKYAKTGVHWCDHLMMGIMRHLIHIFLFTFIFAFVGMLFVVSDENTDDLGLNSDDSLMISRLETYMSMNPAYYGLSSALGKAGYNVSEALQKFAS